jgi:hypothetical protein
MTTDSDLFCGPFSAPKVRLWVSPRYKDQLSDVSQGAVGVGRGSIGGLPHPLLDIHCAVFSFDSADWEECGLCGSPTTVTSVTEVNVKNQMLEMKLTMFLVTRRLVWLPLQP